MGWKGRRGGQVISRDTGGQWAEPREEDAAGQGPVPPCKEPGKATTPPGSPPARRLSGTGGRGGGAGGDPGLAEWGTTAGRDWTPGTSGCAVKEPRWKPGRAGAHALPSGAAEAEAGESLGTQLNPVWAT